MKRAFLLVNPHPGLCMGCRRGLEAGRLWFCQACDAEALRLKGLPPSIVEESL